MALTVNTNIASLTAQRNLTSSQGDLSTSLQRLSSGLRINSAKDDAAGLAISERFTAQIRGLNQGVRNANDGISLAQTAEGALKEVTNNLQRIREIAVQSANATNSASDRTALQAEVSQLLLEIDRVSSNTKFNGINLLDGTFTSKAFQVGADAAETVSIDQISSSATASLGTSYTATATSSTVNGSALLNTDITVNGVAVGASASDGVSTVANTASALSMANAINNITSSTGVSATATTTLTSDATVSTTEADGTIDGTITINGFTTANITTTLVSTAADFNTNATTVANAINALTYATGVTATGLQDGSGKVDLVAADGRNIQIKITDGAAAGVADSNSFGLATSVTTTNSTVYGVINYSSTDSSGINVADGSTAGNAKVGGTVAQAASGSGSALNTTTVATQSGATAAITSIDNALATINSTRATLGSYQSRFESVVANLQTTSENLSASRSRIVDADFAAETAQLTKAQILQQSGIAMLAQANSIPQNVLALLQ